MMKQEADLRYREAITENQIMIIDEDAIPANKRSINEKPEMKKLIEWIKNDKVAEIYMPLTERDFLEITVKE
ncbi:hypothetical protein WKH31_20290 [Metabacillus indicus]|uniref:hypothetical protein n=1 Tax=Metabacillus indicus TaxID=246786 RepID=UPI0031744C54